VKTMAARVKEELRAADAELTAQFGGHGEETATEVGGEGKGLRVRTGGWLVGG
jgi:hypothetical protein